MKTVKNNIDDIRRVSDEEADRMVGSGTWRYCPKSEWKAIRPRSKESKPKRAEKDGQQQS